MAITRQEVEHVAHLGRLNLSEDELQKFAGQLDAIIEYMAKLDKLDTEGVEPMLHGIDGRQTFRPDEVGESLPREDALANAPESGSGCFRVPRIIE